MPLFGPSGPPTDIVFSDPADARKFLAAEAQARGTGGASPEIVTLLGTLSKAPDPVIQSLIDQKALRVTPANGGYLLNIGILASGLEKYSQTAPEPVKNTKEYKDLHEAFFGANGVKSKIVAVGKKPEDYAIEVSKPDTNSSLGTIASFLPMLLPIISMVGGGETSIFTWIIGIVGSLLMLNTGAGNWVAKQLGKVIPGIGPGASEASETGNTTPTRVIRRDGGEFELASAQGQQGPQGPQTGQPGQNQAQGPQGQNPPGNSMGNLPYVPPLQNVGLAPNGGPPLNPSLSGQPPVDPLTRATSGPNSASRY